MPASAKHPATRRKHGATYREIDAPPFEAPPLPQRYKWDWELTKRVEIDWHPTAVENWDLRMQSVMSEEFLDVDISILKRLLKMESEYEEEIERDKKGRPTLATEIRLHEQELGLPLMRRRALGLVRAQTMDHLSKVSRPAPRKVDAVADAEEIPTTSAEVVNSEMDALYT